MKVVACQAGENKDVHFFFQAEDGIRDRDGWLEFRRVLFRSSSNKSKDPDASDQSDNDDEDNDTSENNNKKASGEIGRASCRERV